MKRAKYRPNVVPAKQYYKRNVIQKSADDILVKTMKGKFRAYVEDLCDYCIKPRFIKRFQLSMRVKGYKFLCNDCRDNKIGKFGEGLKNLPCWTQKQLIAKRKVWKK